MAPKEHLYGIILWIKNFNQEIEIAENEENTNSSSSMLLKQKKN
jgi:hypothetical protein